MTNFDEYLALLPAVRQAPNGYVVSSYDAEGDILYVHFRECAMATDSEFTDDIIVRYDGEEVVGVTILHASERCQPSPRRRRQPTFPSAIQRLRCLKKRTPARPGFLICVD